MKSDGRIKTDIYRLIKGSNLESIVSGSLSKRGRPNDSDKEDIVISILENGSGQIQEAFVNVNIYVPDIQDSNGAYIINDIRADELSELAIQLFEVHNGGSFRFILDRQRVLKVDGKNEHFINNRLLYKQSNE